MAVTKTLAGGTNRDFFPSKLRRATTTGDLFLYILSYYLEYFLFTGSFGYKIKIAYFAS